MRTRDPSPGRRLRGPGLAALAAAWLGLAACNHQLPRLNARGQHEEVVERAAKARYLPKRKAARAWASSLVALGRVEEARAVLLRDFRTTADLPSLVALADLELHEGLRGVAATHYARAASLGVDVLRGRDDVCELLRGRAERFLAQGEALAADLDLRRIAVICPDPTGPDAAAVQAADRALHLRVVAAAKRQARAQRTLKGCTGDTCKAPAADAEQRRLTAALTSARATGPGALRTAARDLGVSLAAGDVAQLLAAELRGELGLDIVTHDELRAWIGETAPAAIHASAATLPPVEQAYARLRLAQLGIDYELTGGDAARSTASLVIRLLELFDADPAAAEMSWRVFVVVGDLPSAELALTAGLGVGVGPVRPAGPPPLLGTDEPTDGAARSDPKAGAVNKPVPKDSPAGTNRAGSKDSPSSPGSRGSASKPAPKDSPSSPGTRGSASKPAPKDSPSATGSQGAKNPVPKASPSKPGAPDIQPVPKDSSDPGFVPTQTRVPVPTLWSARRRVDAESLPKLLLLARLRALGGRDDQALEIAIFALAEAHSQKLPQAESLALAEGRRYLASAQPWAAIAIAGAVPGSTTADLARAAGASILLARAACEGACGEAESRDRIAVRQVLGEAWLTAEEARALDLALARDRPLPATQGCPGLAELLAADARGPLPTALALARDRRIRAPAESPSKQPSRTGPEGQSKPTGTGPEGQPKPTGTGPEGQRKLPPGTGPKGQSELPPGTGPKGQAAGEALRRAVEADPTLSCAGRLAGPLFYAGDHRVAAEALADELIHAPQEIASGVLALQSELALGLGRRDQADLLITAAAAASSDPVAVWRRAARMAALVDARHHELLALRQSLMHVPASEAGPLRLALLVRGLRDANDAWAVRESDVGREALLRSVESYLEGEAPARRWRARDDLALALALHPWTDPQAAQLIRAAVWSEPGIQRQHPAAAARLERALGGTAEAGSGSPLAPSELAAALAGPDGPAAELPAAALAFVPLDQLQAARLEVARHHQDPRQRLRDAIAVATTGDAEARVEALRLLLAELTRSAPTRRDAVIDLLLAGLDAAGPDAGPMVPTPDDLLALVYGLTRDPARARPEIKGE